MHAEFTRAEIDRRHVILDPPDRPEDTADVVEAARNSGSLMFSRSGS